MIDIKNYQFLYDVDKNEKLKRERGVGFAAIVALIGEGKAIDLVPHANQVRHPGQWVLVMDVNDYVHLVPCFIEKKCITFRTIYPSRKATKFYRKGVN